MFLNQSVLDRFITPIYYSYRATLGHKINHNFWFYNAGYVANFHPRFGLLAAVKSLRNIKAGKKIL